jgi:hypothetical protein
VTQQLGPQAEPATKTQLTTQTATGLVERAKEAQTNAPIMAMHRVLSARVRENVRVMQQAVGAGVRSAKRRLAARTGSPSAWAPPGGCFVRAGYCRVSGRSTARAMVSR